MLVSHNVHQIEGIVRLADELGVYLVFQPYHQNKTGDPRLKSFVNEEAVRRLLAMKKRSRALLSSNRYLAGILRFCQGTAPSGCQAGRKYFSVDPGGFPRPCVDGPRVGHILRDDLSVVRSAEAAKAVAACSGCWYCFRGEADSTLSFGGYAEKLRIAASVVLRNALRPTHIERAVAGESRQFADSEVCGHYPRACAT